jgi:hypothetical protein
MWRGGKDELAKNKQKYGWQIRWGGLKRSDNFKKRIANSCCRWISVKQRRGEV